MEDLQGMPHFRLARGFFLAVDDDVAGIAYRPSPSAPLSVGSVEILTPFMLKGANRRLI